MAEQVSILSALWRFFTFYKIRNYLGLIRAANRQFTGSASGIRDAFDLEKIRLARTYEELEAAVGEFESVQEMTRGQLTKLNTEEADLIKKRDGALALADKETDSVKLAAHKAAFARYHTRIKEIDAKQAELEAQLKEREPQLQEYLRRLTALQGQIRDLSGKKAEALADWTVSTQIIELNRRLQGLTTIEEESPVGVVLDEVNKLKARAKVSQTVAGADVTRVDAQYEAAAASSVADSEFDAMLAARKAERGAKEGTAPPVTTERPKI